MTRKQYNKNYRVKNKKRIARLSRLRYHKHFKKIQRYLKKYYKKNKKTLLQKKKKYYKTAAGIFVNLKRQAKHHNRIIGFSKEEFILWYTKENKICYYCKRKVKEVLKSKKRFDKRYKRLTLDRINSKKGYYFSNMVLACFRCNFTKNNYFTEQEMLKIGKIINTKEKHHGAIS